MTVLSNESGSLHVKPASPIEALGLSVLAVDQALVLSGVTKFAGMGQPQLLKYSRSELNPRTMRPWGAPGGLEGPRAQLSLGPGLATEPRLRRSARQASRPPRLAVASPQPPVPEAGAPVIESTEPAAAAPAPPTEAPSDQIPEDLEHWTIAQLTAWLKKRGAMPSSHGRSKADLREAVCSRCEQGLANVFTADMNKLNADRFGRGSKCFQIIRGCRRRGCAIDLDSAKDTKFVATLKDEATRKYFGDRNADTQRNEGQGISRHVDHAFYLPGSTAELGDSGVTVRTVYLFLSSVAQSPVNTSRGWVKLAR